MIQDRRQCGGERGPVQVERRRNRRPGQLREHRAGELGAARCLRVRDYEAVDLEDCLLRERARQIRRQDDLCQAGPVPDDEKGNGLQFPAAVQPAGDRDALADMLSQFAGQYS